MEVPVKVLGVDIGGSHITAGWVDLHRLQLDQSSVIRRHVDSLGSKEHILTAWLEVLASFHLGREDRIGIAMPAPFDYEAGIALLKEQGKFRSLYALNIKKLLAKDLGLHPSQIQFSNDAASFLQGEALYQEIPAIHRLIGITLGTGLGSSYRFGEQATDAALWSAPFKGRHAEYYLGTEWFVRFAAEKCGLVGVVPKEFLKLEPELAKEAFSEFGANLGEFLAEPIRAHRIEQVVIGGNLAKGRSYFYPEMMQELDRQHIRVTVHFSQLGEDAALIGAASKCRLSSTEPK
ncbi:MAG: ROK family protein [Lunatimonas sp.]|uniref:ROK family protein n=1 Tax=Lunatimonas sp. TaxID=2060141 RepID=UPI00263B393D|nr:ROK family protein [Lunatimonas sp.]MCC5938696.1 ROK family protein [Lunatimonas sp.]